MWSIARFAALLHVQRIQNRPYSRYARPVSVTACYFVADNVALFSPDAIFRPFGTI